jgi:hypothetical protein
MATYEGWTNYETWSVFGDYGFHLMDDPNATPEGCKEMVIDSISALSSSDERNRKLSVLNEVDWVQLATAVREGEGGYD